MPRTTRGGLRGNTIGYVLFYGVVSAQTEKVVEFFLERYEADEMIREVQGRRAGAADDLRVKAIETRPPCS